MKWTTRQFRLTAFAILALTIVSTVVLPSFQARAQDDDFSGDFTVSIFREEVPTDVANGSMVIGRWRLSFSGGAYEAERLDLGVLVRGSYEVDGETITVTDEEGLLSCANPAAATIAGDDVASGTYTFDVDSSGLTLSPDADACALRRVLFSTKEFAKFIACLTVPLSSVEAPAATPVAGGDEAGAEGDSALEVLATESTPSADGEISTNQRDVEEEIDALVGQMSACWATGDPDRFLPLLSVGFRDQFISGTDDEVTEALASLRAAMQVPIVWERAGELDLSGDDRASAVVRTTAADQEEFVRYNFVLEDGEWRWDGSEQ